MPCPPAAFTFGIRSRTVRSSMIVFTATHSSSLSDEIVGPLQRRQQRQDLRQVGPPHVQHEADAALRLDGGLEQQRDVVELLLLPRVGRARSRWR